MNSLVKLAILIFTLFLTSCLNKQEELPIDAPLENVGETQKQVDKDYVISLSNEGKYRELIDYYEQIITDNSSEEDKLLLAQAYLSYGNAYYSEEEYSLKALDILNNLGTSFELLYLKGYANEIIKDYEEARKYYNEALNLENITLEQKAILLNQIGHTYDLEGDYFMANEYYIEAENMGIIIEQLLLNRGRYEYRNGNYSEAEEYFMRALEGEVDAFIKAEIYFDLSSIYLGRQEEDFYKQAIEYANLGIQAQPNYPYNYTNLGIAYYVLNEVDKMLEPLQKALELYPYSVQTTKYLGIYYYTIDEFEKAVESFKLELENSEKDITIMQDQRKEFREQAMYDISKTYALNGKAKESIEYLDEVIGKGDNLGYYASFILDLSFGGIYSSISETEEFKDALSKYNTLYSSQIE